MLLGGQWATDGRPLSRELRTAILTSTLRVGSMGEMLQERRHPPEGAASNLGLGEQAVRREQLD